MAVRAIFFDLDDTLVLTGAHDRSAYKACAELAASRHAGISCEALVAAYKSRLSASPWDPGDRTPVGEWRARLWTASLEETVPESADAVSLGGELQARFDEVRLRELQWVEGVPDLIESLRQKGFRICVITNGHSDVQHPKLSALRAHELFEHIIVGGDEVRAGRREKPDPSIFMKACDLTGVTPQEAVHVGDSFGSDIVGAGAAGLRGGIWVNPAGKPAPAAQLNGLQLWEVRSAAEVPEVLARLES